MMRQLRRLTIVGMAALASSAAEALTTTELGSLRTAVLEMCRGGTLTGARIHSQSVVNGQVLTVNGVMKGTPTQNVFVSKDEWRGIQAMMLNPAHYSECVDHTVALLAPLLSTQENIDTNLNARIQYIGSSEFCDRLVHVIAQAPSQFAEWRTGTHQDGRRSIGRYLMANAGAVAMTSNDSTSIDEAAVYIAKGEAPYFQEPLLYTHRFQVENQTGLILERVSNAIERCATSKRLSGVDKVHLRSKPFRQANSGTVWTFYGSRFIDMFYGNFQMFLMVHEYRFDDQLPTDLIYLRIEAPLD